MESPADQVGVFNPDAKEWTLRETLVSGSCKFLDDLNDMFILIDINLFPANFGLTDGLCDQQVESKSKQLYCNHIHTNLKP